MEEIMLEAIERKNQTGKFRESGFVAGVIYGDNMPEATPVKFEEKALKKVLSKYGSNAKLWIMYNNEKKYGFIREVQRKPMLGNVTHIDVQIVSKDHEIKRQIPIVFTGEDDLKNKQLQLQVYKSEITLFGKMALMPDTIHVDVSEKKLGDAINLSDFDLDKLLKSENEDTNYGMIINLRNQSSDVADETEVETKI